MMLLNASLTEKHGPADCLRQYFLRFLDLKIDPPPKNQKKFKNKFPPGCVYASPSGRFCIDLC